MSWAQEVKAEEFTKEQLDRSASELTDFFKNAIDENFYLVPSNTTWSANDIIADSKNVKFKISGRVAIYSIISSSYTSVSNRNAKITIFKNGETIYTYTIAIPNGSLNKIDVRTINVKRGDNIKIETNISHPHVSTNVTFRAKIEKKGGVIKSVE